MAREGQSVLNLVDSDAFAAPALGQTIAVAVHLERIEQVLSVGEDCPECGGDLSKLGEDITEELEYIPGRFVVNKITRPRMACRRCEAISQAPMPSRPIERGRPGPGLLAHVLVSKFADHLPL